MMRPMQLIAVAAASVLTLSMQAHAQATSRDVLSGLVGHSKADILQRLGPPADHITTVDGERLFYGTLDAGRFGGRSGEDSRDRADPRLSLRDYEFACHVEIVIRNGRMQAFNRTGNDCH